MEKFNKDSSLKRDCFKNVKMEIVFDNLYADEDVCDYFTYNWPNASWMQDGENTYYVLDCCWGKPFYVVLSRYERYLPDDKIDRILYVSCKDKYMDNPAETRISYLTKSGKRTDTEISLSGLVIWRSTIYFYIDNHNEEELIVTLNNLQWIYENKEKLNSMTKEELLKIPFFYEKNNQILFNSIEVMSFDWTLKNIIDVINDGIARKTIDEPLEEIYKVDSIKHIYE
jgi:hypothetical protein